MNTSTPGPGLRHLILRVFMGTLCLALLSGCSGDHGNGGHSPVVRELVGMMQTNAALRARVEAALAGQPDSSYWHGRTLADMYDFFDRWLVTLPTPENVRDNMDNFYEFTGTAEGKAVVLDDAFRGWLYDFMMAQGEFLDSPESTKGLKVWREDPSIRIDEYIVPEQGFVSFNDFFTRELKPGVRPIDAPADDTVATSPADCTYISIDNYLTPATEINVKGDGLHINDLFGGEALANSFMGGQAVLCMLGTEDYHHFHAPVSGQIVAAGQLAGLYYGMDGGWVDYFFQHRRGYFIFDTVGLGRVGMVSVGMFTISSIQFERGQGEMVAKGERLGHFAYGGSAILLFFEPGRALITLPINQRPVDRFMGQMIGTAPPPTP